MLFMLSISTFINWILSLHLILKISLVIFFIGSLMLIVGVGRASYITSFFNRNLRRNLLTSTLVILGVVFMNFAVILMMLYILFREMLLVL